MTDTENDPDPDDFYSYSELVDKDRNMRIKEKLFARLENNKARMIRRMCEDQWERGIESGVRIVAWRVWKGRLIEATPRHTEITEAS